MSQVPKLSDLSHDPDPNVATAEAIAKLGVTGDTAEILWPAVLNYFRDLRRSGVRQAERTMMRAVRDGVPAREAVTAAGLLHRGFALPSRLGIVLWKDATVADHRERIEFLRRKVAGIEATVRRHEWAITTITAAGVTCLADLGLSEEDAA